MYLFLLDTNIVYIFFRKKYIFVKNLTIHYILTIQRDN